MNMCAVKSMGKKSIKFALNSYLFIAATIQSWTWFSESSFMKEYWKAGNDGCDFLLSTIIALCILFLFTMPFLFSWEWIKDWYGRESQACEKAKAKGAKR